MKKLLIFISLSIVLSSMANVPRESEPSSGQIVTRHILDGVKFEPDSLENPLWDLTSALETGIYDLRLRADADSVFDITARGQRLDFRISKSGIRLWGLENSRMRLADSQGLKFAALPLGYGITDRSHDRNMHPVGFSNPDIPDSISICSGVRNRGIMVFPDGDSLSVARHDVELFYEGGTWHLSYWLADSILLPVARQYVNVDSLHGRKVTFSYTYPSELEAVKEVSKQVLGKFTGELYSENLFSGKNMPQDGESPAPGEYVQSKPDNNNGDYVEIPLSSTPPGETFTCHVADAKGILWQTSEGVTDFNRARVSVDNLPAGYYFITVRAASGEQNTVKHYHESR